MSAQHTAHDLFERAEALAKQRNFILAYANDPQCLGIRRQMLCRARKVERVITGIGELAVSAARAGSANG